MSYRIGILALQGDFAEHCAMIRKLGHSPVEIRRTADLNGLDGLIIPGGESTTVAILEDAVSQFHLKQTDKKPIFDSIAKIVRGGMPVWGTCMGSIILAKEIEGSTQGRIGLIDITVRRNAYGPQRHSSQVMLDIPVLGHEPFPAVFIRAPLFIGAGSGVEILARFGEGFVMAREKNILVSTFHPELTSDTRVHEYFLSMISG